jgi:hypothetical protein
MHIYPSLRRITDRIFYGTGLVYFYNVAMGYIYCSLNQPANFKPALFMFGLGAIDNKKETLYPPAFQKGE